MKTINWGILGAARVNQRLLPAIENNPHSKLIMLASRRDGAAEECIHQYSKYPSKVKASQDFDEVIQHPDINAIYIPLANEEHTEVALKAIQHKKHVLIEKPMALTKDEVIQITNAAKKNEVQVMEGFMYVFHPQFDFIQQMIASGKLGRIQYAHSMFSFPIQPARYYRINRSMKNGGGALWDIGPYAIHTLRQVMGGHIKQVNASAKMNSHQADMSASGILEFTDQRRATFDISFECTRRSEFEIFGEKGRLKCHTIWQHENDEAIISYELDGSAPVIEKIQKGNHFDLEVHHFVDCIQNNKESNKLSMSDAVNQAAVMEAVYQSIQKSKWVLV
ncbi:Gfo/Idh/MocA family oxidoreductase [Methylophilaceae bacterium]|nr:Gfo/Idh/MocA family oxidoreductase [Methylophilaceae bacterium]